VIRPLENWGLKLFSLVLAVMLWMAIAGEETVERGMRIPLELQQFPPALELRDEAPSLVDVRVRGASDALSRVGPGDIVAVLDLHAAGPGQRLFQLTPEQVRAPFGVQAVQVTPATIVLAFEKSASKPVRVVPAVEGIPAAGYSVGKIVAEPATVEVTGPESAVARVNEALTEPVSVAGARQDVRETATVGFLDPTLRVKSTSVTRVTVQVQIASARK
jgi:YbbR domain-containing protein